MSAEFSAHVDLCGWPCVYVCVLRVSVHVCVHVHAEPHYGWTWGQGAMAASPLLGYRIWQVLMSEAEKQLKKALLLSSVPLRPL